MAILPASESMPLTYARAVIGSLLGAVAGYLIFGWLISQGFLAMLLPGALVGLGCGLATARRSREAGIIAGVVALLLSLFLEWKFFPDGAESFLGFLGRLPRKTPMTLAMIIFGGYFGFWFGQGRAESPRPVAKPDDKLAEDEEP